MKIAVVVPAAGSTNTLATTAFIGALMEGFSTAQVDAHVVGLTFDEREWVPEALGTCATSAPWLPPTRYRLGDRADAVRRGIFEQSQECREADGAVRWRLELALERQLCEFSPEGRGNTLIADTRSLPLLRIVLRVAHRLGWKVVVVSNEALTDLQIDPATRDSFVQCVANCTEGLWVFSEYLADHWKTAGVPEERIFVSPPVVRPSSFAQVSSARGSSNATYIGNLAHREIGYLLQIAQAVVAQMPDFKLTIYGDAPDDVRESLTRKISGLELTKCVTVEQPVSPTAVPGILGRADVLLLPRSRGEFSTAGFPNKLGEYLSSGRPVVVTRVGDIPRYLTDGKTAFLVEPDDNDAFASAVVRVLRSPELGTTVGTEGRRVAETTLRADIVAKRLSTWMNSLSMARDCAESGVASTPLWRRLGVMGPDRELTRRDISLVVRRFLPKR